MSRVALEAVKRGLQVDFADDDTFLAELTEAAESHVANHLRRDLDVTYPIDLPQPITQAIRLLVGHWYAHRQAVDMGDRAEMPLTVTDLLAPYRDLS